MFADFFYKVFQEDLSAPAIIYKDRTYNYSWLSGRISYWTSELIKQKIKPGRIVSLTGDFSPNSISLLFALIENRNIIVPFDNQKQDINKKAGIAQTQSAIIVDEEDNVSFEENSTAADHAFYEKLRALDHPGLVLFTSGTSGEPKAAVHDLPLLLEKFKVRKKSFRTLQFLLFDHWGGLNTMFHTLSNGGVVLALRDRRPETVCSFIEKHKIELLPASPTFLNLLLFSETWKHYDLSSIRLITYGTEPMLQTTLDMIRNIFPGVKLQQTYGLIELGVLRSRSQSDDSLWVQIGGEGFETRIVDGLLEIKARSAMMGYLNAPSPFTEDGWFMTGDQVEEDGEYIKILGRKSELINVGGEKVYPAEVESTILQLEFVKDCFVYSEENIITGHTVCADVVIRSVYNAELAKKEIRGFCSQHLSRFKVPSRIRIVDAIHYSDRFKKVRKKG